ncbi:MAG: hypothetical protein CSA21_00890 [Deltaproteobacteria bacterium]|nr:MAG: hypothetical protein CSA21_00890 [Deltaproteobacteria bacterium]
MLIGALEKGAPAIFVRIVDHSGSTPRRAGAKMVVHADGSIVGTIGGGRIEGTCIAQAKKMFAEGQPGKEMRFHLTADDVAREDMICGGALRILLQKIAPTDVSSYVALRRAYHQGERPILITALPSEQAAVRLLILGIGRDHEVASELQEKVLLQRQQGP